MSYLLCFRKPLNFWGHNESGGRIAPAQPVLRAPPGHPSPLPIVPLRSGRRPSAWFRCSLRRCLRPPSAACGRPGLPDGAFGVITELEAVGRQDFINGNAQFVFIPSEP